MRAKPTDINASGSRKEIAAGIWLPRANSSSQLRNSGELTTALMLIDSKSSTGLSRMVSR